MELTILFFLTVDPLTPIWIHTRALRRAIAGRNCDLGSCSLSTNAGYVKFETGDTKILGGGKFNLIEINDLYIELFWSLFLEPCEQTCLSLWKF